MNSSVEAHVVDMVVVRADGSQCLHKNAFMYWLPGEVKRVEPSRGCSAFQTEVSVTVSDLGCQISEVLIGGEMCAIVGNPSSTQAIVSLPKVCLTGCVPVEVRAPNGNSAILDHGFTFYTPDKFGPIGCRVELSEEDCTATRKDGVNGGICIGVSPLRRFPEGRYFELDVQEVSKGVRTIAVGVTAARPSEDFLPTGRLCALEAQNLKLSWLAGYDKAGALFLSDGEQSKIPTTAWRPLTSTKVGTRLGVLWADTDEQTNPQLVIFQDGEERARLVARGRLPDPSEDLFALVDLQGSVKKVTFVQDTSPPELPTVASN